MSTPLPPDVVDYIIGRDREHAAQIDAALAGLTDRERALVREAAVMGYVRGGLAAGGIDRDRFPRDTAIVRDVVGACQAVVTGFPLLGTEARR